MVEGDSEVEPIFVSPLGLAITYHVLCPSPLREMKEAIITDEVRHNICRIAATLTSRKSGAESSHPWIPRQSSSWTSTPALKRTLKVS